MQKQAVFFFTVYFIYEKQRKQQKEEALRYCEDIRNIITESLVSLCI